MFRETVIKPLPSQDAFLDAMYAYEYILFGGAAGPGKSYILRWALVELLIRWFREKGLTDVKVGLFCENYPALKDRHISEMNRKFPLWLGEVKSTLADGLCFFLRSEHGSGKIALRNLDDPSKYQSVQFAAIAVDELTKNKRDAFDDLRARKRWPGIEHSPFLAASNPGSIGHAWVKKLWLDKDFSGEDSNLDPSTFLYIPARGRENPFLPESYWMTLHSLPEKLRKAMEEGNWDVYAGQYFSDWDRNLHVVLPGALPTHWRKIIAFDYGFENPSSVGWYAISPDGVEWIRYRELYQKKLTYAALGREIMERTPLTEMIEFCVADPAIWGDRPHHDEEPGETGGEMIEAILEEREIPLLRANNDRIQGWQRCRELLKPVALPDGRRGSRFKVFSTGHNFIRTIPSMIHDDVRVEDLDTHGEDHCADEFRYAVSTTLVAQKKLEYERSYESALSEIPPNYGIGFKG